MRAESELYKLCGLGFFNEEEHKQRLERIRTILAGKVDVNNTKDNPHKETALSCACKVGSWAKEAIKLLLAHPDIDVEKPDIHKNTPFYLACAWNNLDAVILLLKTGKVDIENKSSDGTSPFWTACSNGSFYVAEHLLAYTNVDFTVKCRMSFDLGLRSPREVAGFNMRALIQPLLTDFETDKEAARMSLRKKLGIRDECDAAQVFVLISLCSGGHFTTITKKETESLPPPSARFLDLVKKLPTEIQMMVCNRLYRIHKKDFIPSYLIVTELGRLKQEGFFVLEKKEQ